MGRVTAADLTAALVAIDSVNPALVPGGAGEAEIAAFLVGWAAENGLEARVLEATPGRPSVIVTARGRGGGRTLLLCGHTDTVGVDGMAAPHTPRRDGDRLYGRGTCDMKAGLAAALIAARDAAAGGLAGDVVVACVADEEHASLGVQEALEHVRADAAIVTEPTRLAIMPAHKGFAWIDVTVRGRAAHGSRHDVGVDAIRHAGLLLAELDALDAEELTRRPEHPLLGRASLHASTVGGGIGLSTYPDRCALTIERRTIPGESARSALAEVEAACDRVRARRATFEADVSLAFAQPPSDVAVEAPIVRALAAALADAGEPVHVAGMSAWTDAALLNDAGIPAICFGPGDISLAHAHEEWVPISELHRATDVLARLVASWCG